MFGLNECTPFAAHISSWTDHGKAYPARRDERLSGRGNDKIWGICLPVDWAQVRIVSPHRDSRRSSEYGWLSILWATPPFVCRVVEQQVVSWMDALTLTLIVCRGLHSPGSRSRAYCQIPLFRSWVLVRHEGDTHRRETGPNYPSPSSSQNHSCLV